jgi:hypothetical protein
VTALVIENVSAEFELIRRKANGSLETLGNSPCDGYPQQRPSFWNVVLYAFALSKLDDSQCGKAQLVFQQIFAAQILLFWFWLLSRISWFRIWPVWESFGLNTTRGGISKEQRITNFS